MKKLCSKILPSKPSTSRGEPPWRAIKPVSGFTFIELLVVFTIIGVLALLGLMSYKKSIEKANIARAQSQLQTLKSAMMAYYTDVGELPPRDSLGDNWCTGCSIEHTGWDEVVDFLMTDDGAGWNGPYLKTRIDTDPWGRPFAYDDNADYTCCGDYTYICSDGPNKKWDNTDALANATTGVFNAGGGDDICVIVMLKPQHNL